MKRFVLVSGLLAGLAVLGLRAELRGTEADDYLTLALSLLQRAGDYIRSNPVPFAVALGTFLATVLYHKAKGKSLRESVEAAATRVTVVTLPAAESATPENPVIRRAQARATRTQLLTDQIGLQNRQRKLPEEITKSEKDVCHLQQFLADAEKTLGLRKKAHAEAVAKLKTLRQEKVASDREIREIGAELEKLATLV